MTQITIDVKLLLRALSCGDQYSYISLWRLPEVSTLLESLPENGTEYIIYHTTAARGPTVVYFTIRAWLEFVAEEKRKWLCVKSMYSDEHWTKMYPNGDPPVIESKEEVERYRQLREQLEDQQTIIAQTFYKKYAIPDVKIERPVHPLETELYTLCETASTALEFTRVVELKGKLRRLGIKVDERRTSIRKMAKL